MIMSGLMLFAALLLVALNGLFVAAEFAFTKLRSTRVETMVQEGRASAELIREATGNLDGYLAVCQVGITIASLGLGALGEPAIADLLDPLLAPLIPESLVHTIAFAIAFGSSRSCTWCSASWRRRASPSPSRKEPPSSSRRS
jgi:CBS domain containing-hemolysin-like protein